MGYKGQNLQSKQGEAKAQNNIIKKAPLVTPVGHPSSPVDTIRGDR